MSSKPSLKVLAPDASLLSRRQFLGLSALGLFSLGLPGCASRGGRNLNIYNYSYYIAPDTITNFRQKTDISIVYDEFSSQDVLFAKLKLGAGYDLVVASDYMLRRLIRQQIIAPIEGFELYDDLISICKKEPWLSLCRYCVPYLWGTTGIGYNRKYVKATPTSWNDLWDEDYAGRITMLDEKRDSIGAALIRLGYNGNSTDQHELNEARRELLHQKRILRQYTNDYIDGLVRGEIWLAQAWSGDISRAKAANPNIDYILPQEGSFFFIDSWCIPSDALHKKEAVEFLNFVMQPENVAKVTNFTSYPNTISSSRRYVNAALIDNPLGYPPADMMARTFAQEDIGANEKVWDRMWEDIKFKH